MSYLAPPSVKLKTDVLRALFPDDNCILVGRDGANYGALTTPECYERFVVGPCHLHKDGSIVRYGKKIGTIDDVEIEKLPAKEKTP